jgi:hypothetical protein
MNIDIDNVMNLVHTLETLILLQSVREAQEVIAAWILSQPPDLAWAVMTLLGTPEPSCFSVDDADVLQAMCRWGAETLRRQKAWDILEAHFRADDDDRPEFFSVRKSWFSSKHWSDTWPEETAGRNVTVSYSVQLQDLRAQPHWIFDNDVTTESFSYGSPVSYPQYEAPSRSWNAWAKRVEKATRGAARAAWEAGFYSCSSCGNHVHAGLYVCECGGDDT